MKSEFFRCFLVSWLACTILGCVTFNERNASTNTPRPASTEPKPPVIYEEELREVVRGSEEPRTRPFELDLARVQQDKNSVQRQALKRLQADQATRALKLTEAALPRAAAKDKAELHWLAAKAAKDTGDTKRAADHLQTLSLMQHPLKDWAKVRDAMITASKDAKRAAQATNKLRHPWSGQPLVLWIAAKALKDEKRFEEAKHTLRRLLAIPWVGSYTRRIATDELALLLADSKSAKEREEAVLLLREVALFEPSTSRGLAAKKRAEEVRQSLPKRVQQRLKDEKRDLQLESAKKLYASTDYSRAKRKFRAIAAASKKGDKRYCEAKLYEGRILLKRKKRSEGAKLLEAVAKICRDPETLAWALYQSGRAKGRLGQWKAAIKNYDRLLKAVPEHRLADDARWRSALCELELGRRDKMLQKLEAIPNAAADGDMWPEALFRLAWEARKHHDYAAALRYLNEMLERGTGESNEDILGRAAYWHARTLSDLNRRADATRAYADLARRWPLRYYGQLALARLQKLAPAAAAQIRHEMRNGRRSTTLQLSPRQEYQSEAFERAIALLRVGESNLAADEFHYLGMLRKEAHPELRFVASAMLQSASIDGTLDNVIRRQFKAIPGLLPSGEHRALWELAYPKAFAPLIEKSARREKLPPELVRAFAREESSFDPKAVSWAKAYGLVQLILPTAKRFAKDLRLRATPQTLKQPRTNLRIGTRFMAWLWDRLDGNVALVVASYNAGEGAVRRWLKETPTGPLDVFIEEIPYDETRRYTRRVLQSYGVYTWLAREKLPELPNTVVSLQDSL